MDKIVVRANADMSYVLDWAAMFPELPVELSFREGEIEFQEELLTLRFAEEAPGLVQFELLTNGVSVVKWHSDLVSDEILDVRVAGNGERKAALSIVLVRDNTVAKCVRKFRALMQFAANYREEVSRTRTVSRSEKPKKGNSKRSNVRYLTIRKYTIDSELISGLPAPKRPWKGYSESFAVRGHYRRYQSGKVVWVRPYEKHGRNDKKSDREWVL